MTKENIGGIVDLLITDLNKRLADREIEISVTDEAKAFIIDHGYDPIYGARPLKRYLQKNVETLVARLILSDQLGMNQKVTIDVENGELTAR